MRASGPAAPRARLAPRARTTILIAHRLATVAAADLVFVFAEGRVVEWGPPAALAEKQGGAYAELLRASRCEVAA